MTQRLDRLGYTSEGETATLCAPSEATVRATKAVGSAMATTMAR